MMEENSTPHPDYLKGFNEGYVMQQHAPKLAQKLSEAVKDSDRGSGFKDGAQQFNNERSKERLPAWLQKDRFSNPDKGSDKTKGQDKDDR